MRAPAHITYIALPAGWAYLVAILEWFSRFVLAWDLSVTRDGDFCVQAWHQAVERVGRAPEIMNTDQGVEFCSGAWLDAVQRHGARISQDGRGRGLDNVIVERLWRTVKQSPFTSRLPERARAAAWLGRILSFLQRAPGGIRGLPTARRCRY